MPRTVTVTLELEIEGTLVPHWPGRGPSYGDGGLPPEGGYCEDLCITLCGVDVSDALIRNEQAMEKINDALMQRVTDEDGDAAEGRAEREADE